VNIYLPSSLDYLDVRFHGGFSFIIPIVTLRLFYRIRDSIRDSIREIHCMYLLHPHGDIQVLDIITAEVSASHHSPDCHNIRHTRTCGQ
jgi:hypothetical protein